jgi:CubicO group peptidase (beta-lactamase class C family)
MILERRTGRPFTSVVEDEIFRPMRLANTRYTIDAARPPAVGCTRTPASAVGPADEAGWYPAWKDPKPGDEFILATPIGGGYSTVDDLARFADALIGNRLLSKELTNRVLTGYIDAGYGGRDGYGFETRLVNGVRMAGHRGSLAGSANQLEFYPDLSYVLIVLGNTDTNGTQYIAAHVRALITSSARR